MDQKLKITKHKPKQAFRNLIENTQFDVPFVIEVWLNIGACVVG